MDYKNIAKICQIVNFKNIKVDIQLHIFCPFKIPQFLFLIKKMQVLFGLAVFSSFAIFVKSITAKKA